jgi:hypothetical protein
VKKTSAYAVEAGDHELTVVFAPTPANRFTERLSVVWAGVSVVGLVVLALSFRGLSSIGWVSLVVWGLVLVLYLPAFTRWRRETMVLARDVVTLRRGGIWPPVVTPIDLRRFCVTAAPPFLSFKWGSPRIVLAGTNAKFGWSVRLSDEDAESLVTLLNAFLDGRSVLRTSAST